ncbi:MAG TPA: diaminopimelate epimerase [Clostridia bacterium]|nr:diaminopimelate epimerase [Clostridia bacterium]
MLEFTKMHGLGNDYVYIDCTGACPPGLMENLPELARRVSDRHFGVGSDGLVLILPSETADFRMRMFNADGSEAEMCGNAIRCVGKYVYDRGLTAKTRLTVETLAGIKELDLLTVGNRVELVQVDMGEPVLDPKRIPVLAGGQAAINLPVQVEGETYRVTCVSMGNPHAVIFVEEVDRFPVAQVGPRLENHPLFPNRINVEFVQVIDEGTLKMRVWERGAGETMACGTGACAVLVASVLNGVSQRQTRLQLLGGDLLVEWREDNNRVYMTGPAVKVFDGELAL